MVVEVAERVGMKPTHIRLTPSQQIALESLRRRQHLTRAGLLEEALAAYFKIHGEPWPSADRRRP